MSNFKEIAYKGTSYKCRTIEVVELDSPLTIAPMSLYNSIAPNGGDAIVDGTEEQDIDDSIYFYVEDELINESAQKIFKTILSEYTIK